MQGKSSNLISEVGTPDTGGAPPIEPQDTALFERLSTEIGDEILGPPGARPIAGPFQPSLGS